MESGRLTITTQPSEKPVKVSQVKDQLRLDHAEHDTMIGNFIDAAWNYVAGVLDRTILTTTYELTFDEFPDKITLRKPPVQSVASVEYKDTDGSTQTLTEDTDYYVTTNGDEGEIKPDVNWPHEYSYGYDNVTVTYDAGYGTASDVPQQVRQAIISMAIDMYEQPGASVQQKQYENKTIDRMLGVYKRHPVL